MVITTGLAVIKDYSIVEFENADKVFQVGSISKCLTSLCVMRLVQKGKLSLNEDVNNYFKSWKVKDGKGKSVRVTLKELLSHTTGISCSGFSGYKKGKVPSINKILNSGDIYQKYKSGTYHYSGGGFVIIQKILEDVLGKSFDKIMKDEIFKPLGMKKSGFNKVGNKFYSEKAAAGLCSTSRDLAKFLINVQRCYNGKSNFLSQKFAKKMLRPVVKAEGNFMALGFFVSKNKKKFYHAGHNPGYRSKFVADLKGNGVVVLRDEENSNKLIADLIRRKLKG